MRRRIWQLAMVGMVLLNAPTGWANGVGTPITRVPYTITQSGFYYLKSNLTALDTAITIDTDNVTLDLMGFSLTGPSKTEQESTGIYINENKKNVEVRNGQIEKFYYGIYSPLGGSNHHLISLKVTDCYFGINDHATGIIITGCQATANIIGIYCNASGGLIDKNTASDNTTASTGGFIGEGFHLYQFKGVVTNNAAYGNDYGFWFGGNSEQLVDRNSSVQNNVSNWENLSGCTVGLNTP